MTEAIKTNESCTRKTAAYNKIATFLSGIGLIEEETTPELVVEIVQQFIIGNEEALRGLLSMKEHEISVTKENIAKNVPLLPSIPRKANPIIQFKPMTPGQLISIQAVPRSTITKEPTILSDFDHDHFVSRKDKKEGDVNESCTGPADDNQ